MKILINQFFGLGDVIFCQQIANHLIEEGHTITWPVLSHFVEGLARAYPNVTFVDYKKVNIDYDNRTEREENGYYVLPLRWNVELLNVPYTQCMSSKYDLMGLDWQDWRKGAMWQRDERREATLREIMYRKIHSQNTDTQYRYNLINDTFGSELKHKVKINVNNGLPNIYMSAINGYSLFDLSLLIENATEIHTVSTSIIYILEMLDLKAPQIHLYNRPIAGQGFDNIDYILTKHKYIFHG